MVTTSATQGNTGEEAEKAGKAAVEDNLCWLSKLLIMVGLLESGDAPWSKGVAALEHACNSISTKYKNTYRTAIRFS